MRIFTVPLYSRAYFGEPQFKVRQRIPPSNADQAQLRKISLAAHLLQALRAIDVEIEELAWEKRVHARMAMAHDNYLRPMPNNHLFPERYTLR